MFSKLEFTYSGTNEFDLNFALGYNSRSDVSCYIKGTPEQVVTFSWLTDSRVRIDPEGITTGDELVFLRTVSKTDLPVDLKLPGNLDRESVENAVKHTMYAVHEVLDNRVQDFADIEDQVFLVAQVAIGAILSSNGVLFTRVSIPDDTVIELSPPRLGGFIRGNSEFSDVFPQPAFSFDLYFDIGSSPTVTSVSSGTIGSRVNASTIAADGVLTGTAGPDGDLNIRAGEDILQVENRTGQPLFINLSYM